LKGFTLVTEHGSQRVRNHNKLLGRYDGMRAAKTGWTRASQHTYAASVKRGSRRFHLVLLRSPNKWVDSRALFDYAFELYPPEEGWEKEEEQFQTLLNGTDGQELRPPYTAPEAPQDDAASRNGNVGNRVVYVDGTAFLAAAEDGSRPTQPREVPIINAAAELNPPESAPFSAACAEMAVQIAARPQPERPAVELRPYSVRKGDTLGAIARRHGTTVAEIMSVNNLASAHRIYVGQQLKIP
jgi:D-alanyl-D-alanine carboxypeptidase